MKYLCILMMVVGLMGGVALGGVCYCPSNNYHYMNCTTNDGKSRYNPDTPSSGKCPTTGNHGPNCTWMDNPNYYSSSC